MRLHARFLTLAAVCCAIPFSHVGCDFSSDPDTGGSTGPINPGGGGTGGQITTPLFFGLEGDTQFCVGESITILGVNFSSDLAKNSVNFTAGVSRIPGMPLRVEFPTDGNSQNGLESRLRVLVPAGISSGNVELVVNGIYAGATGYDACPQLMAYLLQRDDLGRFVVHEGPLGYSRTASYIKLVGLNFGEIEEVEVEDSSGNVVSIPPSTIERNPTTTGAVTTGVVPTGYSTIGFNLHDDRNNVLHSINANRRDNIFVRVRGSAGLSNSLQIPVVSTTVTNVQRLGAAINGVKVPTGVSIGTVRVYYVLYDLGDTVANSYKVLVEWTADDGKTWFPATADLLDPAMSGTTGILPGTILHRPQYRLFSGGGAYRVFSWDAAGDANFIAINQAQPGSALPGRNWQIQFRITPTPEGTNVIPINHTVVTPKILYYYLEDRGTTDIVASDREGNFVETFTTTEYLETRGTTATWGPPNEGALVGYPTTNPDATQQFGVGTAEVILRNLDQEDLPLGTIAQFYEIDTDLISIIYHQTNDNGTPDDATDDIDITQPVDFANPGQTKKEFHLARLLACPDVRVGVVGSNPLIIRLSGEPAVPSDEEDPCLQLFDPLTAFGCASGVVFDLNGQAGGVGVGGRAGSGGGAGGAGGNIDQANGVVTAITHAGNGANDGGLGGETTAAWDREATAGTKFPGASGGGGGSMFAGGAGDPGTPAPNKFKPPRGGAGGPARGDARLRILCAGAGGGGGGGSMGTTDNIAFTVTPGGGGGGGGGAFQATANGKIQIDAAASIQVNGGNGGSSPSTTGAGGAGGGGSGGCILLQARFDVAVSCASLLAQGGIHGTSDKQNKIGGSGDGSPGWIRIESGAGGAPTCISFAAKTVLSARLSKTEVGKITVQSTAGFPSRGRVLIESEEIDYQVVTATTLEAITRAAAPVEHASGSVVYYMGAIKPYANTTVFSEGAVVASPDPVDTGRGRDGELHIRFIASIDPASGEPLVDAETGAVISVWRFDTDLGVLTDPSGNVVLETGTSETDPGLLDLTRLIIDRNSVLRGKGSRALRIQVLGEVDIAGSIDVSGFDGGLLIFQSDDPAYPLPGVGGAGGPGAGAGGDGGLIEFRNGDPTDKDPENVVSVNGSPAGQVPWYPKGFDKTPVPYGDGRPEDLLSGFPIFARATPGMSRPPKECGGPAPQPRCIETGGGGGGGGNLEAGKMGNAVPLPDDVAGEGGTVFGVSSFRFNGDFWIYGSTGGSGGGASPHVSTAYAAGIPGEYRFKKLAKYAPGTGGGGGGGMLYLSTSNLLLRSSGRILARGGNAYQSIDLGGNGGAGAGGNLFVQVKNALTIEQGAVIDVSGGVANLAPKIPSGRLVPDYEPNIRLEGTRLQSFGGDGGNGSPGRIRMEAETGSLALLSGLNGSLSAGPFFTDTVPTVALSKSIRLGVGPGRVASTPSLTVDSAQVRFFEFGQPLGTDAVVLWEGAAESLDQHGSPATFQGLIRDVERLHATQFVRFRVSFLSNFTTQETQSINDITIPYRYERQE